MDMDSTRTLEVAERMMYAGIGESKKWAKIIRTIRDGRKLGAAETEYYTRLTRIYGNCSTSSRSRIIHSKLSKQDERPPCRMCGSESSYYCNMNDEYFCDVHVVGHDENEL